MTVLVHRRREMTVWVHEGSAKRTALVDMRCQGTALAREGAGKPHLVPFLELSGRFLKTGFLR